MQTWHQSQKANQRPWARWYSVNPPTHGSIPKPRSEAMSQTVFSTSPMEPFLSLFAKSSPSSKFLHFLRLIQLLSKRRTGQTTQTQNHSQQFLNESLSRVDMSTVPNLTETGHSQLYLRPGSSLFPTPYTWLPTWYQLRGGPIPKIKGWREIGGPSIRLLLCVLFNKYTQWQDLTHRKNNTGT